MMNFLYHHLPRKWFQKADEQEKRKPRRRHGISFSLICQSFCALNDDNLLNIASFDPFLACLTSMELELQTLFFFFFVTALVIFIAFNDGERKRL